MDIFQIGLYLMLSGVIPLFYAEWVGWPGDVLKRAEPPICDLEEAIERSFKYMISITLGMALFSTGTTMFIPLLGYIFWGITAIVLLWLRHGREQLKLKLQEARMKEAIAKGIEIGMKKANES